MFYENLSYIDGIINSEVGKHPITLSFEDFVTIYKLTFIEKDYNQMYLEGNEFNFDTLSHTLLTNLVSIIPSPCNVGLLRLNVRLIHYIMKHILFPGKGNYITVLTLDIIVVWVFKNQFRKNWVDEVLTHILECKRKNTTLYYAKLITKILHYTGYPSVEEEPIYAYTKREQATLNKIGYAFQDEEIIP
ncbi:hypothetical protein RYX36_025874 [Vicia faba]